MKIYGSGGIALPFLTSALDGGVWSASRRGRCTAGERARSTQWIGDWVGPRAGLDAVDKRTCRQRAPCVDNFFASCFPVARYQFGLLFRL
jgi:hypothetical protein